MFLSFRGLRELVSHRNYTARLGNGDVDGEFLAVPVGKAAPAPGKRCALIGAFGNFSEINHYKVAE
jgi:hypothetical protein